MGECREVLVELNDKYENVDAQFSSLTMTIYVDMVIIPLYDNY